MEARKSFKPPLEIIDMILLLLRVNRPIAGYAAISKTWREGVEALLFRSLKATNEDFALMEHTVRTHRYHYVRELEYWIIRTDVHPTPSQLQGRYLFLTYELRRLFTFVNAMRDSGGPPRSTGDFHLKIVLDFRTKAWGAVTGIQSSDLPTVIHSRICAQIPILSPRVTSIDFGGIHFSFPGVKMLPLILSRARSAREATLDVWETRHKSYNQSVLGEASTAIRNLDLNISHLQHLTIHFLAHPQAWDQYHHCVHSEPLPEFNATLRHLATRLKKIHLLGGFYLTPDFFCPMPWDSSPPPVWNIEEVVIQAHPGSTHKVKTTSTTGTIGGRDDKKYARLGDAVTRAMLEMPKLRLLSIQFYVQATERLEEGVIPKPGGEGSGFGSAGYYYFDMSEWLGGNDSADLKTMRMRKRREGLYRPADGYWREEVEEEEQEQEAWNPSGEWRENWLGFKRKVMAIVSKEQSRGGSSVGGGS